MKTPITDPIELPLNPSRVHYEIGTLLAAEDFNDEQAYHRGRLACALAALHGGGTLTGLKVSWVPAATNQQEELQLSPGLALDRFGRLIEVPRTWCIRLDKWYKSTPAAELARAFDAPSRTIICDLYIRFESVEFGRTPSFARTTFDTLNATTPARRRDAFHLDLIPRLKPTLPKPSFEEFVPQMDPEKLKSLILDSPYGVGFDGKTWAPQPEHEGGVDTRNLFLARIPIPADPPANATTAPRRTGGPITPDNLSRRFVIAPGILTRFSGL